jgi:uncharacterized protein YhdP
MPYSSIAGNFSVKDGSLSTSDLSIFSPSINIIIVGTVDFINKNIDFAYAVQLLQTVDTIVSRIPVIGWILTGADRRFLVSYFEARGNWNDPTVYSINTSSMSQGLRNIFHRALSLPEMLITDTNKVLGGN